MATTFLLVLGWTKVVCFLVYVGYTLYCLQLFHRDTHKQYAMNRRPKLIISLILANLGPVLDVTFISRSTCVFSYCASISKYVEQLLGLIPFTLLIVLITCRAWFIFYDLRYSERILLYEWWQTVNVSAFNKDWFIANRQTFGSFNAFMSRLIVLSTLLWIAQVCATLLISEVLSVLLYILVCNLLWIVQLLCFCKMNHYDVYSIRREITRQALWYLLASILFSIAYSGFIDHAVLMWTTAFFTYFNCAINIAICTLWPYHDHQRLKRRMEAAKDEQHLQDNQANGKRQYLTWQQYVNDCSNDEHWNHMMLYLTKEFSVENLCFLLEAIQFKQQFIAEYDALFAANNTNGQTDTVHHHSLYVFNDETYGWCSKLPRGLPLSGILVNTANTEVTDSSQDSENVAKREDVYKEQVNQLFAKYVRSDAVLQINISEHTKKNLMADIMRLNRFDVVNVLDVDEQQQREHEHSMDQAMYLKIFDHALKEINENLMDSFLRFKLNDNTLTVIDDAISEV